MTARRKSKSRQGQRTASKETSGTTAKEYRLTERPKAGLPEELRTAKKRLNTAHAVLERE